MGHGCLSLTPPPLPTNTEQKEEPKKEGSLNTMASISISASLQRGCCSSKHIVKKQGVPAKPARSLGLKQVTHVATLNVEGQKNLDMAEQRKSSSHAEGRTKVDQEPEDGVETESSAPRFIDERWKRGNWDLNMFVHDGKVDWDGLITAEAKRRKFLELYPEASTNEEPVLFKSSIIPWWAWLKRSYLPEAELLNGRAAMVGFFMAYTVDALTGLDMVGQTGNFVCKAGLFVTVISVILLRRTEDLGNLRKLIDEATFYDKQWRASWQDQSASSSLDSEKNRNKT